MKKPKETKPAESKYARKRRLRLAGELPPFEFVQVGGAVPLDISGGATITPRKMPKRAFDLNPKDRYVPSKN